VRGRRPALAEDARTGDATDFVTAADCGRGKRAIASMRARIALLLLLLPACHFFVPDTRTPADRAGEIMPRCAGFTEEAGASLLSPAIVDSVEPAYAYVQSGPSDRQARLRGARIRLRPIAGLSRESIDRSLECHESRVVLGATPALVDDPYALAGEWLDIDVDSEKDGFVVQVETDDLPAARDVLQRAKRFAAARAGH
jgi:hypothetical protein